MADSQNDPHGPDEEPIFAGMLAQCPELGVVVEEFVRTLPERMVGMQDALREGSFEHLQALACQLKDAGVTYGYQEIAKQATAIEQAAIERALTGLDKKLAELTALIQHIHADLQRSEE